MKMIERAIYREFQGQIKPGRVLILLGARRVGKTHFLKQIASKLPEAQTLFLNGEDQRTIDRMVERSVENFKLLLGSAKFLFIDEAQNITDIGGKLKLLVDEMPDVHVIVTGSSMFELNNKLGQPLVGRSHVIQLFPLAQIEYQTQENSVETFSKLEQRLIFGSYPELLNFSDNEEKIDYLEGIVSSYLLKDILAYEGIKKADKIIDLLRLIAFQIGNEVSLDELAINLKGISRNTIESYLDLLSKVFIIYPVKGFSRNLRKEISKSNRWYFYDNGIRNALIRNYNPLNLRNDQGQLWENYLMAERMKVNAYLKRRVNTYFWRTYDQQEIDLIEESGIDLSAFEFKWKMNKVKIPAAWKNNYPSATFEVIHNENYLNFVLGK
ncbi:MAG: ATP-binding protein [Flavobacteriia bacterium]